MLAVDERPVPAVSIAPQEDLAREWREHALALLGPHPSFAASREFLRRDIERVMRRLVPADGRVLEIGVGSGHILAALPNSARHGIDILPEAIEVAHQVDRRMELHVADAMTFPVRAPYDSIICDRLIHTVPDVQRLLERVGEHLHAEGRIFLT